MSTSFYHHRLLISYKGTLYFGWQDLGAEDERPTVQATVHHVLKKICNYTPCKISSASRTDAGVHAQGQVLKISMGLEIASKKLLHAMNSHLPKDIRILQCEPCSATFNPNRDSTSKEYHYYFCTDTVYSPVLHDIVAHVPSTEYDPNSAPLDIAQMKEACKLFVGEHDFYNFSKRDVTMQCTLRTIVSCEIVKVTTSPFANDLYTIKIVGTGFLRFMVRYIAGALFALGKKKISINDISEALENHKEKKINSRAKPHGLHLIQVFYSH